MDSGEVHRKNIIKTPENWDEMKEKYIEREEELVKKALEKKNVPSVKDLENIAKKTISTRLKRAASDQKPLKDRTIQKEAKSPEILELKKKLDEEISSIAKTTLKKNLNPEKPEDLKGRITPTLVEKPGSSSES